MATARVRQQRIPLEELARLPSFYLPLLSWARDKLAFYWDKTGRIELYVMDLATRTVRQVSHGEVPRALKAGFVWDRSDRVIVFGKDRDGDEQNDLYAIEVETGAVTQLTSDPTAQEYPGEFSPDNAWLTVVTNKRTPDAPDRPGQVNVWKVRPDGSEYQPLTRFPFPAWGGQWSDDGRSISFVTNEDPTNLKNRDGYVIRPDGSGVRRVFSVRAGSQDVLNDWHPDGRRMAVTSDASGVQRVGILDLERGDVRWLGREGVDESAARLSDSGRRLVCLRNQESQLRPIVYDVETGAERELQLPPGAAFGAQFVDDDRLLMTYTTDTTRPGLILYDLPSDACETLLEPEYGSIDPEAFVEADHVSYKSSGGTEIPALLYRPRGIPEGTGLPAIVHVHGGPTGQWFRGFDPFAQFLVDRGFVVLEPNVRGSTGYGVAFRDAALKDWAGVDLEDVAAGAAYLKALPYVDPERLVVFGGSYGGYMTFMAVTKKPEIWRAGVAWVGITDLKRMYDQSMEHFKYFLREQMGDPDKDAALWADRSAINFAQNLEAKLLMIHGATDPRCPVDQSRTFRDRLLELGRKEGEDFEYAEFADEGHGSTDIEQKIRTFKLLAEYLERVL
ncbi:MAG TPA: S9 family peptidase [Chloroflexota bacterium]|jgi:dipeptidyl aminopeptidase/acylaminoacyl peptidase|nr:S9 family peptidase [Chloroflexota bacterium]